ncbi:hypothetical protein [Aeoliella mucimassa]|uniref:Uncharacterized protein n=1 Tax=Aeoliella mucimassa TaxID=2527972 RepID=A0A518AS01_9BACT|nr:hypothetical protein [Aeoliella mucimassa]QDU57494.1 hypothetical protein Pan181_37110 [Aeoliella mucimassa]
MNSNNPSYRFGMQELMLGILLSAVALAALSQATFVSSLVIAVIGCFCALCDSLDRLAKEESGLSTLARLACRTSFFTIGATLAMAIWVVLIVTNLLGFGIQLGGSVLLACYSTTIALAALLAFLFPAHFRIGRYIVKFLTCLLPSP